MSAQHTALNEPSASETRFFEGFAPERSSAEATPASASEEAVLAAPKRQVRERAELTDSDDFELGTPAPTSTEQHAKTGIPGVRPARLRVLTLGLALALGGGSWVLFEGLEAPIAPAAAPGEAIWAAPAPTAAAAAPIGEALPGLTEKTAEPELPEPKKEAKEEAKEEPKEEPKEEAKKDAIGPKRSSKPSPAKPKTSAPKGAQARVHSEAATPPGTPDSGPEGLGASSTPDPAPPNTELRAVGEEPPASPDPYAPGHGEPALPGPDFVDAAKPGAPSASEEPTSTP